MTPILSTTNKTIKPGTIRARCITDADAVFTATVHSVKGNFATVTAQGTTKRHKIHKDSDGVEYVYALGRYSMAPVFKANSQPADPEQPANVIKLDLTPKWEDIVLVLAEGAVKGNADALAELKRCAQLADAFVATTKQ
jgi:hypothetical protein